MSADWHPVVGYLSTPVTRYRQNCSVVWCKQTGVGALVDPGGDVSQVVDLVARAGVQVNTILVTHGHLDHAGSVAVLARRLDATVVGPHLDDTFLLEQLADAGTRHGIEDAQPFVPDRWLEDGDQVDLGALTLQVFHCPGHTPGHVVFFEAVSGLAFVGDVLFRGSVGRTDLPRGNFMQLARAIRGKLFPLGDNVRFVCGHGDESTFGWERQCNPFVCDLAISDEELGLV